jgi:hypothetical protein
MAGPACEVLINADTPDVLNAIDQLLGSVADVVERTRKGRVWDIWIRTRPIHVCVNESLSVIELSAGGNTAEDYELLRMLGEKLAGIVGGLASEPEK